MHARRTHLLQNHIARSVNIEIGLTFTAVRTGVMAVISLFKLVMVGLFFLMSTNLYFGMQHLHLPDKLDRLDPGCR